MYRHFHGRFSSPGISGLCSFPLKPHTLTPSIGSNQRWTSNQVKQTKTTHRVKFFRLCLVSLWDVMFFKHHFTEHLQFFGFKVCRYQRYQDVSDVLGLTVQFTEACCTDMWGQRPRSETCCHAGVCLWGQVSGSSEMWQAHKKGPLIIVISPNPTASTLLSFLLHEILMVLGSTKSD